MATVEALLTAEEYLALPDDGQPSELVQGRIIPMNVPYPRHGQICSKVDRILGNWVDDRRIGHIVGNDSGVVTERDPDTVRGPDLAYYSFQRVPPGPFPQGYLPVVPELAVEVRSATDRWGQILTKVGEYLVAGVTVVCVLDETTEKAHVYRSEQAVEVFSAEQELTLPDVLPSFPVVVKRFFE